MADDRTEMPGEEPRDPWLTQPRKHADTEATKGEATIADKKSFDRKVFGELLAQEHTGYELVGFLGEGTFGQVWKAVRSGGVKAALKFIRLSEKINETELRSLKLMTSLPDHPHIVSVHGVWQIEGFLIVAMALGEGTLADRLQDAVSQGLPGIPIAELLDYMSDAARGIDYLVSHDIIHRDIKPHNMLVVGGGGVKIMDFGLAKYQGRQNAINSGAMTPAYAPPEFFNDISTPRSDQFSLAVTYCQLRTNCLPFGTRLKDKLDNLHDLSGLEAGERDIVQKALATDPDNRWPDCRSFVQALKSHFGSAPQSATRAPIQPIVSAPPTLSGMAATQSTLIRDPAPTQKQVVDPIAKIKVRPVFALAGVLAAIAAAVVVWGFASRPDPYLEMRRLDIEREVANVRSNETMPLTKHPAGYEEVDALDPFDNAGLNILSDDRVVDMRSWKEVPANKMLELYSPVVENCRLRLKKTGPAKTFCKDGRTTGRDLFFESPSPYPLRVVGQRADSFVGNDRMKVRRMEIDLSGVPENKEFDLRYSVTRWNSLQTDPENWHGVVGYEKSSKVSMLLLFPEQKPFKRYSLKVSRTARDRPVAFEGPKIVLAGAHKDWLYWEIPDPNAGFVYRLHWDW
jgi:eukaryotic-like serine/threonine-protein kinase